MIYEMKIRGTMISRIGIQIFKCSERLFDLFVVGEALGYPGWRPFDDA